MAISAYQLNYIFVLLLQIISIAGCIIAGIILADYLLPGKTIAASVTGKQVESNQRYPGRYSTTAYNVQIPEHDFYVEKDFFM